MLSQASVILFTGGVSAPVHAGMHTPLGQVHPLGRYTPQAGTPPAGTPPGQVHPPSTSPSDSTPPLGQQAGGTHPTGMLSCFTIYFYRIRGGHIPLVTPDALLKPLLKVLMCCATVGILNRTSSKH